MSKKIKKKQWVKAAMKFGRPRVSIKEIEALQKRLKANANYFVFDPRRKS